MKVADGATGGAVEGATLAVKGAKALAGGRADATALFSGGPAGGLVLAKGAAPGPYQVEVVAQAAGFPAAERTLYVAATIPATLSATVAVNGKAETRTFPETLGAYKITAKDRVEVTVKVDAGRYQDFVPHQKSVIVKSLKEHRPIMATFDAAGAGGTFKVAMTTKDIAAGMGNVSGEHRLIVAVGDPGLATSYFWELATLTIKHKRTASGKAPAQPKLAYFDSLGALTEITHLMRPPEKRPPAIVSLLFAGLTAAPLVLLVNGLKGQGVNLKRLPKGGVARLDAALFVGGIVAILGLYVVYWLGMTLLAMLPILGGLGAFTWVFGYRALFHLANPKVKGD